ncbi:MAG TPA: hypothetical protein VNT01_09190 [Symbiobacteriaceae bacterium]|nr:hypothetical protein [Symbiobacteriaceae bacterium]
MKTLIHLVGPVAAEVSPVVERVLREELAVTGQEVTAGPAFYGVYPFLFADLVPDLDSQLLADLGQFCREYATFSIWLDKLMDRQAEPEARLLLATAKAHQHAIRRLGQLFLRAPRLWEHFDQYVTENVQAVLAEAALTLAEAPAVPLGRYLQIAEGKVAVAKIAATTLAVLGGKPELVPRLERMQMLQARGMQLSDDVQDWKEDLRCGRPSYPLTLFFRHRPDLLAEAQAVTPALRREILRSQCFEDALTTAHEAFSDSLAEARALGCRGWERLVTLNLERLGQFRKELSDLQARLPVGVTATEVPRPVPTADEAVRRGLSFLCGAQETDGRFLDFAMPPGFSDGWMTGYVAVALDGAASTVGSAGARQAVQRAAGALQSLARPGGWGYNHRCATDGDSTAFAVRALLAAGQPLPEPALQLLTRYLDAAGHGHTFRHESLGEWNGRHADVTPSLGLALHAAGAPPELLVQVSRAALASRGPAGTWAAYWWRHSHYSTWLNLKWLRTAGALQPAVAREALEGLQCNGGLLPALETACLLGATLEAAAAAGDPVPQELVTDLLQRQLPDGSWPSSPSLILPSQNGADGSGDRAAYADIRRLFTTATAVTVLARLIGTRASEGDVGR